MVPIKKVPTALLALSLAIASASPLSASPFSAPADVGAITPAVRPPSGAGPLLDTQRTLRERSALLMRTLADDPSAGVLATVLMLTFIYGILHAAGPGHRKTIVFSAFIARDARSWEPLLAGFMSAGVHAGTGAALVAVLGAAYGAVTGLADAETASAWLDLGTYGLLVVVAVILLARKGAMMLGTPRRTPGPAIIDVISTPEPPDVAPSETPTGRRGLYGMVALASIVPCPGAVMLLLFSAYSGVPGIGLASVLTMSLGMGMVISIAGYLAWFGRRSLFTHLKRHEASLAVVSDLAEMTSYLLILGFSLYMVWPFLSGIS